MIQRANRAFHEKVSSKYLDQWSDMKWCASLYYDIELCIASSVPLITRWIGGETGLESMETRARLPEKTFVEMIELLNVCHYLETIQELIRRWYEVDGVAAVTINPPLTTPESVAHFVFRLRQVLKLLLRYGVQALYLMRLPNKPRCLIEELQLSHAHVIVTNLIPHGIRAVRESFQLTPIELHGIFKERDYNEDNDVIIDDESDEEFYADDDDENDNDSEEYYDDESDDGDSDGEGEDSDHNSEHNDVVAEQQVAETERMKFSNDLYQRSRQVVEAKENALRITIDYAVNFAFQTPSTTANHTSQNPFNLTCMSMDDYAVLNYYTTSRKYLVLTNDLTIIQPIFLGTLKNAITTINNEVTFNIEQYVNGDKYYHEWRYLLELCSEGQSCLNEAIETFQVMPGMELSSKPIAQMREELYAHLLMASICRELIRALRHLILEEAQGDYSGLKDSVERAKVLLKSSKTSYQSALKVIRSEVTANARGLSKYLLVKCQLLRTIVGIRFLVLLVAG